MCGVSIAPILGSMDVPALLGSFA
jgi:hypothetical protein